MNGGVWTLGSHVERCGTLAAVAVDRDPVTRSPGSVRHDSSLGVHYLEAQAMIAADLRAMYLRRQSLQPTFTLDIVHTPNPMA